MTFVNLLLLLFICLVGKHPANGRGRRQMITVMLLCFSKAGTKNIQFLFAGSKV